MGGRTRKPTAMHLLAGNPSKKLLQHSGFMALGEPFIPEHLMDDARGCIDVIRRSMPPQIYSTLDSFLLAAYGLAWAIHKRAALEISNPKFEWIEISEVNKSPRQSPWIKMANEQAKIMISLGARLGLDPISRDAMRAVAAEAKSDFDGLLTGQVTYSRDEEKISK